MRSVAISVAVLATAGTLVSCGSLKELPAFTPTEIKAPFLEQFTEDWADRWTASEATKKNNAGSETFSYVGKWKVEEATKSVIKGDKGLVAKSPASHHAISVPFKKSIDFKQKPLVVQYEVNYQKGGSCGGGYIKLLEDGFQSSGQDFDDKTPWVVMFGPDLTCPGTKVHFIVRHKSPMTEEIEEKHFTGHPRFLVEKYTNLHTLVLHPNNTFNIYLNGELDKTGNLLEDMQPPVNPPTEIDDPSDSKPDDWVEDDRIIDVNATKPDNWDDDAPRRIPDDEAEKPEGWLDDELPHIPDPDATKPDEWDDEEDGDWVAPTMPNPKCANAPGCGPWERPMKNNPNYKGRWTAPLIDNPDYKGPWAPRKIPNPNYFEDPTPVKSLPKIGGVGIELWTMTEDILFDNLYIGHSLEHAKKLAAETFDLKQPLERLAASVLEKLEGKDDEDNDDDEVSFKDDPVGFIRNKVLSFVENVKEDPIEAFKTQPETGVALLVTLFTIFGMFSGFLGFGGASAKPVITQTAKKADISEKKSETTSGDDKKDDLKKRK